jgi:serine phosphatase RsbU (regulator of sigma subunit)
VWLSAAGYATGMVLLGGVYLTSLYSYNLFHGLAELFSVVVEAAVFVIVWNARRYFVNNYLLSLGVALLFVAGVELLHTLAYEGMGVFPGYTANLPTQLWLVARYLQTLALILAPMLMSRRLRVSRYLPAFGALWAILLVLVFTRVFPDAFIPGSGLTRFKIVSEYVICVLLLTALGLLVWRRRAFEVSVLHGLAAAILVTILSEILFTLYTSPFGPANLFGHLLKVVAFYFVYRAVAQTALRRPYSLLFRELKQSEEELRHREEEQRQIADALQGALLVMPKSLPGITFGHLYRPASIAARVGGDFCDLFVLPQHEVGLLVGDVSGHGLEAAALTAVAKDTIEAFAFDDESPAAALRKANLVVLRTPVARKGGTLRFVTAFYGVLNTTSGRLRFASAGHPPAVIRRASGETFFLAGSSPVLGAFSDSQYRESEEVLSPGDLLLLYTDGLTDVRSDAELFGEERLLGLVASLAGVETPELPEALFERVVEFSGEELSDDLAILAVSLKGSRRAQDRWEPDSSRAVPTSSEPGL